MARSFAKIYGSWYCTGMPVLLVNGSKKACGDRRFPGAAIAEIGDGLLGLTTADDCERGDSSSRGAEPRGIATVEARQGAHKIAAIETASF